MRIRDPRSFKPRIRDLGIKKFGSGIRNKHPGSATLLARSKRRTELHLGISGEVLKLFCRLFSLSMLLPIQKIHTFDPTGTEYQRCYRCCRCCDHQLRLLRLKQTHNALCCYKHFGKYYCHIQFFLVSARDGRYLSQGCE